MYNFDQDEVEAFTRRINKMDNGFKFNDHIPNNMNVRRPGSRVPMDGDQVTQSMESTGIGGHLNAFAISLPDRPI